MRIVLTIFICLAFISLHAQSTVEIGDGINNTILELKGPPFTDVMIWDNGNAQIKNSYDIIRTNRDFMRFLLDANDDQSNAEFALYKDSTESDGQSAIFRISLDGFNSWLNSGNFGIGDHNPTERLTVNGAIKLGSNNFNTPGVIRFHNGTFEGYSSGSWRSLLEDEDSDSSNEIQTLTLSGGDKITISSGNSITLSKFSSIEDDDKDTFVRVDTGTDNDEVDICLDGQTRAQFKKTSSSDRTYLSFPNNGENIIVGASGSNIAQTGNRNIYIGDAAGSINAAGNDNIMIGKAAGTFYNDKDENVLIGNSAGVLSAGSQNVMMGHQAGASASTNRAVLIGYQAGQSITSDSAVSGMVCIGYQAGQSLNTELTTGFLGSRNVLIGYQSGYSIGGVGNVMIGSEAGRAHQDGDFNTMLGEGAGRYSTSGSSNTFIGTGSGNENSGDNNTFIGKSAGQNHTTGSGNTFIGDGASSSGDGIGDNNVVIGKDAEIGDTGMNCTVIGENAGVSINSYVYSGSFGSDSYNTADDQYRIGSSSTTSIGGHANWSNVSDGRFKHHVQENVIGLDFIKELRPVTYQMKSHDLAEFIRKESSHDWSDISLTSIKKKESIRYTGFIAQEVEAVAQGLGFDFSGIDAPKNEHDVYALRYAEFVVPLVKAVQELSEENAMLRSELEELKVQVNLVLARQQD